MEPPGNDWGLKAEKLGQLEAFEPGLLAQDGQALLRVGGEPGGLRATGGEGAGPLYLNILFDRYPPLRQAALRRRELPRAPLRPAGPRGRAAFGRCSMRAGARSARPGSRASASADSEVVGILTEPIDVAEVYGRDGVRVYDDSKLGKVVAQDVDDPSAARVSRGERPHRRVPGATRIG